MSFLPIGLSAAQLIVGKFLTPIFIRPRLIGRTPLFPGFVADATIEETHTDRLRITDDPVEQGASVTDHSYKLPAEVVIKAGWTNSSILALGNPNYVQQIYAAFLALQASRQPFDILTGKRAYTNMLAGEIVENTTKDTENAMVLQISCRQIILVNTSTASIPSSDVQKTPSVTGSVVDGGAKSLQPAPSGTVVP